MNRYVSPAELFLLCGLGFFLPIAEAPKNIFLFSLLVLWAVNSLRIKNYGSASPGVWIPLVSIILLSWLTTLLVSASKWAIFLNTIDFLSISGLTIILVRSTFMGRQVRLVLGFLFLGVFVAIGEGHLRGGHFPSLKSVGHINQTAIYLTVMTAPLWALFFSVKRRVFVIFVLIMITIFLILIEKTNSRNALYATGLSICAVALVFVFLRFWRGVFLVLGVACTLASLTALLDIGAIQKQFVASSQSHHLLDDARLRLWSGALKVALEQPVWGYGVGNFSNAHSPEIMRRLVESSHETYNESDYYFTDHAHNLTLNWLVERGVVALLLFYFWFAYVFWYAIGAARENLKSLFWSLTIIFCLCLTFFCGLGNTSWHHEHGLLAAILIGLAFSRLSAFRSLGNQSRI